MKELHTVSIRAAQRFLSVRDYTILASPYECEVGGADIVCLRDNELVFVEVKEREGTEKGFPSDRMTQKKRDANERTALSFLANEFGETDVKVRFDVISICVIEPSRALIKHHINV